jgi:hypothetical protein
MKRNYERDSPHINRESVALVVSCLTTALNTSERLTAGELTDPELVEGVSHTEIAYDIFSARAVDLGVRNLNLRHVDDFGDE